MNCPLKKADPCASLKTFGGYHFRLSIKGAVPFRILSEMRLLFYAVIQLLSCCLRDFILRIITTCDILPLRSIILIRKKRPCFFGSSHMSKQCPGLSGQRPVGKARWPRPGGQGPVGNARWATSKSYRKELRPLPMRRRLGSRGTEPQSKPLGSSHHLFRFRLSIEHTHFMHRNISQPHPGFLRNGVGFLYQIPKAV